MLRSVVKPTTTTIIIIITIRHAHDIEQPALLQTASNSWLTAGDLFPETTVL